MRNDDLENTFIRLANGVRGRQITEDVFVAHEEGALADEGLWALRVRGVVLEGCLHEP